MGLIRRTFKYLVPYIFSKLFKTVVRPHLEYGASVWSPYLKKDIREIEAVQRRATKQINNLKDMSYRERLESLRLPNLLYRRGRGDMIECYKLLNGKYDPEVSNVLTLHNQATETHRTRGHSLKLYTGKHRVNQSKYFFSNRVTRLWNALPEKIVRAVSTNSFKNLLDDHWANFDIIYDFDKSIDFFYPE